MNRILILALLIYALILLGLATFENGLLALSLLLILFMAAGLIFRPREIDLEIVREIYPERASPGSLIEINLTIKNRGKRLEEVLLEDILPPQLEVDSGTTSLLTEFGEQETRRINYTLHGKRGIYYLEGVQGTAYDRFGLFRRTKMIPAQASIFVMPQVPKIKRVAIRPRQTHVYSGTVPARLGGPGVEFFGVRQYQPGDALQHINWRASARHIESLYSNEFEQERVVDVGLILDARRRIDIHTAQCTLFEHLVTATAALTETLIHEGNRVGLLIYGGFIDWTFPRYGKVQRERIFRALARTQTGDSLVFERLENLPTRVFPAHSQIILISPLINDDVPILVNMRAHGYQVMVISPDPVAFQQYDLPLDRARQLGVRIANIERKLLIDKLRNAGIIVLNWDVSTPFDQAMQVALSRLPMWQQPFGGRK